MMKTYQDIKSAAYMDAIISYAETLLDIRFNSVKKNRCNAPCPFHADSKDSLKAYVNKDDEVRFHCFGECRGDWDIYELIMLRKKCRFKAAQQIWADHLEEKDFRFYDGDSPRIPEADETTAPDDLVVFAEPEKPGEKTAAALKDAAKFYNDLLLSDNDRFKHILDYLSDRGIEKDTIRRFNIGYAPPYSDEQYRGRALIDRFSQRFEKDYGAFSTFSDGGLVRFLNDKSVRGYGYYCRQIDFERKYPYSRNYGDSFAGRIVFPIYDADACLTGFVGRGLEDRGVRWLKHQTREIPLSPGTWLYGIEKAARYIRQYRTIILTEGIFDYFAFYRLLQPQDRLVLVSTLGSYITPEAANILKSLDIKHFIAAYDWDEAGRNGIERLAFKSGGWVYYPGGPAEGQDPSDKLEPVLSTISGFSEKDLKSKTILQEKMP